MASVALDPAFRRISVDEFLEMDCGGAKAELEDGLIYMMAGGSPAHARVPSNLIFSLRQRLRGSGCFPYGSDLRIRTGERSIRFPDVSVHCGDPTSEEREGASLLADPTIIFEVLSPSTRKHDEFTKLPEYQALQGVMAVVLIELEGESIRLIERRVDGWIEHGPSHDDLRLDAVGITLPHSEIFAHD